MTPGMTGYGTIVPVDNGQNYLRGITDIASFAVEKWLQSGAPASGSTAYQPAVEVGGITSTIGTEAAPERSSNAEISWVLWGFGALLVIAGAWWLAKLSRA